MTETRDPQTHWTRRRFIGASAAATLALGSSSLLREVDAVTAELLAEARIEFDHARARPGHEATLNIALPRELRRLDTLQVMLLKERGGHTTDAVDACVAVVDVPLEGAHHGRDALQVSFSLPWVPLTEAEREEEGYALTAALSVPGRARAVRTSSEPLDVIVSPFYFGI